MVGGSTTITRLCLSVDYELLAVGGLDMICMEWFITSLMHVGYYVRMDMIDRSSAEYGGIL